MARNLGGNFAKALLLCLLIAGTLDILDALIFYGLRGVPPARLLQSIASGLLGAAAFRGGLSTAALGLGIHYTITLFWAALFLFVALRLTFTTPSATAQPTFLTSHAVLCGLIYGAVIYVLMNFVVLPHTRMSARGPHPAPIVLINGVLALLLFMGLPIALIARHFSRE